MISTMKNLDNLFYKIHFCKFSYKLANLTIYQVGRKEEDFWLKQT